MYSPTVPFSEYLEGEQLKYPELTRDAIETLKNSLANENLPPITGESLQTLYRLAVVRFYQL